MCHLESLCLSVDLYINADLFLLISNLYIKCVYCNIKLNDQVMKWFGTVWCVCVCHPSEIELDFQLIDGVRVCVAFFINNKV